MSDPLRILAGVAVAVLGLYIASKTRSSKIFLAGILVFIFGAFIVIDGFGYDVRSLLGLLS